MGLPSPRDVPRAVGSEASRPAGHPWYETLVLVLQMDGLLALQKNGGLVMQKDMLAA